MFSTLFGALQYGPLLCRSWIAPGVHDKLYAALICGIPIGAGPEKQLFLDSGLIHILVVSGAHLIFLERLLGFLPSRLRLSLLGFYCWLTGFGAPIVRAFVVRLAQRALAGFGWSTLQIEAVAVAGLILVWPPLLLSRSLQMSWMCALAAHLPPWVRWPIVDLALKVYLALFVFVGASAWSILWNILLAPLISGILFPGCLLTLALPLRPLVDQLWALFLDILSWGPKSEPHVWFFSSASLFWIPPLLHFVLLQREVRCARRSAFS